MTRQDFLNFASGQPRFNVYHELYTNCDLVDFFDKSYKNGSSSKKVVDFLNGVGRVLFERTESKSGDVLEIYISSYGASCYWQNINCMVSEIGAIRNCTGVIETFYISEYGKFYNQNHKLIAENEEDFFDYITTVEFDFHPEIPLRTYHILRHFGWYEGRHIDTSEFEQKAQQRSIEFTREQLDFLSEFSNLYVSLPSVNWSFSSLNDILEHYTLMPFNPLKQSRVVIEHAFACGFDDGGALYLTGDGLIATSQNNPLGKTTMECINHLCNYTTENDLWLDNLLKQDEAGDL